MCEEDKKRKTEKGGQVKSVASVVTGFERRPFTVSHSLGVLCF